MRRLVVLGMLSGATSVRAGNGDFHATANGSVATTDNETGAETGSPDRKASIFSDVRPGMLFTYNSRRMIHELVTDVDLLYHFGQDRPNVVFHGDWKAFFLPTPRSELTLNATGMEGQMYALSAGSLPTEASTQVVPLGRVNVAQGSAGEQLSWVATEMNRVWQRGFARYTTTEDTEALVDTKAFEGGAALGIDREYRHDSFGVEAGASYVFLQRLEDPMMPRLGNRQDHQINPRGVVVWQHDFNKEWSSNVEAGGVYVIPYGIDPYNPMDVRKPALFPIFGVTGAYTDVWGRAQIAARRQVTPNLFIAQNTLSDSLKLTLALPLPFFDQNTNRHDPRVVGLGSAGVERSQLIDPSTGMLQGEFKVVRVDFGVGWQPWQGQTFGIRYEFSYQNGDTIADLIVPTFFRNTIYFTYSLRYPQEVQVRVPRREQSVRADRTDLAPIGAEPVVNDPAEELLDEDKR